MNANWAQVVGTVFVGVVGLWVAHNYRRQIRLKLAERQVDAYTALWTTTSSATPERTTPLDLDERQKLYDSMVDWYFHTGSGIFLPGATRDLFVGVRSNLVCPIPSLKPASLAEELASLSETDAERRRGCVVIRQVSLLRAQLKSDLDLYFDFNYYSVLRADDRAFLKSCGISPWRKPWRQSARRSSGRAGPNPCVCGSCRPLS